MPITLVIADDHPLILDAMENLFRLEKDLKVVARCLDGDEALKAVRRHQPDILVLDIQMPAKDGLVVLREMRKEQLPTRVVVLTATLDEEGLTEAVRLGVRGLVLKELAPKLLVQCIRKVHAGELWLEKRSVSSALEKLLQRETARNEAAQLLIAQRNRNYQTGGGGAAQYGDRQETLHQRGNGQDPSPQHLSEARRR